MSHWLTGKSLCPIDWDHSFHTDIPTQELAGLLFGSLPQRHSQSAQVQKILLWPISTNLCAVPSLQWDALFWWPSLRRGSNWLCNRNILSSLVVWNQSILEGVCQARLVSLLCERVSLFYSGHFESCGLSFLPALPFLSLALTCTHAITGWVLIDLVFNR